ncbi:hypothetical protein NRF20_11475 [Streptomyces sp. R-74717]|uniref:hypothetical protein n=1 Tax=Streptomyces sp. R-74717 TaxID=2969820 RepID=UPI0039B44C47
MDTSSAAAFTTSFIESADQSFMARTTPVAHREAAGSSALPAVDQGNCPDDAARREQTERVTDCRRGGRHSGRSGPQQQLEPLVTAHAGPDSTATPVDTWKSPKTPRGQVGTHLAGWFQARPLWDQITASDPDLFD